MTILGSSDDADARTFTSRQLKHENFRLQMCWY